MELERNLWKWSVFKSGRRLYLSGEGVCKFWQEGGLEYPKPSRNRGACVKTTQLDFDGRNELSCCGVGANYLSGVILELYWDILICSRDLILGEYIVQGSHIHFVELQRSSSQRLATLGLRPKNRSGSAIVESPDCLRQERSGQYLRQPPRVSRSWTAYSDKSSTEEKLKAAKALIARSLVLIEKVEISVSDLELSKISMGTALQNAESIMKDRDYYKERTNWLQEALNESKK
ncbi:Uncharacterized protein Fot_37121 [Forsythia ovata]|uniref:Uncharacterized protein n=1 Tax=Forsythia ovata TaxID=205694 RepID=A0ABD1SU85_9LAMI